MDKKEKKLATYKEFAKMLQEVANIYSKLGDEPLPEEGYEREDIDVTKAIAWGKHVTECREKGIEPNYK